MPDAADRATVLGLGAMLLPAVEPGSGPFRGRAMRWTRPPATEAQKLVALSLYLALMTDTCPGLIGAAGPAIVEGPFARNGDYLGMLAAPRPEGVEIATSATGTSTGAALLALPGAPPAAPAIRRPPVGDAPARRDYARHWRAATA